MATPLRLTAINQRQRRAVLDLQRMFTKKAQAPLVQSTGRMGLSNPRLKLSPPLLASITTRLCCPTGSNPLASPQLCRLTLERGKSEGPTGQPAAEDLNENVHYILTAHPMSGLRIGG